MRFFKSYNETHQYKFLPPFSRFLLNHQLDAFVKEQLRLSYEVDLPLLKRLKHYPEAQLIEIATNSMREFLQYLSENKARELIELSLERWRKDQLEVIGKFEVVAEDITLINYIRGRAFRLFIPLFTNEVTATLQLVDELDSFLTGSTTASTNMYILLLKDQIARHEDNLLEAQRIARVGSFELDLNTYTSITSPEIYNIYNIPPGTNIATFYEYVHPLDREMVKEAMAGALITGIYESEYRFLKDGRQKHIWSRGIVIYEAEIPVKMRGTVQDITDRKEAEQQLLDKTMALERSNESLQQFAYVASHDLKEPLRKISIYTDMVLNKEKNISESSRTQLQKLHVFSNHMRRMIDDIMAYSTFTRWEEKEEYPLQEIVQEAMFLLEFNIKEKNADILFEHLPHAVIMPSQFRHLFQNLISNALKFCRPGASPKITITHQWLNPEDVACKQVAVADRYLQLAVQDNGIGFEQGFAEKIFGLFSRLNSKADYEGNGLGLAIAKRITNNHGGIIQASSIEGKGTRFTIIIPQ